MAYWIQGLFFQPVLELVQIDEPEERFGINEGLGQFMFHGALWVPAEMAGRMVGVIEDRFGTALLRDIELAETRFSFTKTYPKRGDSIKYVFEKKDGPTWVGTWSGPLVGEGIARCLVTELPDDFLEPESIQRALERNQTPRTEHGG